MKRRLCALIAWVMMMQILQIPISAETVFVPPECGNETYNLNFDWRFKKPTVSAPLEGALQSEVKDGKSFYEVGYDDSAWESVHVPHAPNAEDSFDNLIKDAGEASLYRGYMFYRKRFMLPAEEAGKKFILEFEAVRQSVYLYANGQFVGYYEAGTAPIGFDVTQFLQPGAENLIAVATDNAAYRGTKFTTKETIPTHPIGDQSGIGYQWNQKDFNEVQGGITGNVNLYASGKLYQTRPLYNNLKTTGNYIYATDFDIAAKRATVTARAEIRNETPADVNVTLEVSVVDREGRVAAQFASSGLVPRANDADALFQTVVPLDAYAESPLPTNAETVEVSYITASAPVEQLHFWSTDQPYLYDVYTVLRVDGVAVDCQKTQTGFRKVSCDAQGGLLINDERVYLRGYAQRSTNEWAVIGVANDWLSDYDMQLVRESGADFIRWMHVTPKPNAIRAGDKSGVVSVCPAGDKESDSQGRYWDARVEAMRDAIIYFRNSPSVIFYEAGNAAITAEHMEEMTKLKRQLDPNGGRLMGCRSLTDPAQIAAAEWVGTMIYRYDEHAKRSMTELGHQIPMVETEYKRDESPRRVWDDYSPPDYDYKNRWLGDGGKKTDGFDVWDLTQEDLSVALASAYDGYSYFYRNRVGGSTGNDYYSAAAMMVWSDSNMHGRNSGTENCRTSGRVDPVRIRKESFYALQVMQSDTSAVHIVGHWNYPANTAENYNYQTKVWEENYWRVTDETARRDPTDKTVYVLGSQQCSRMELYINGALRGTCSTPRDVYVYEFPHIDVTQSGEISAVAYNADGQVIARDRIETSGDAAELRLRVVTGPEGLRADGSDVCFVDVEVVDQEGRICPLNYDRIDFALSGDGRFLGGYNSGMYDETSVIRKSFCYAECGVNRVFVRSAPMGKAFTLTATMEGLPAASVTVEMVPFALEGGLTRAVQQSYQPRSAFEPSAPKTLFDRLVSGRAEMGAETAETVTAHAQEQYSVKVNGRTLTLPTAAYRPDSSSGVLCPLRPVLDALLAEGAKASYTYQTEGELPEELRMYSLPLLVLDGGQGKVSIVNGETALHLEGGESNLTNAQIYADEGELIAELAAALAYIPNVQVRTDSASKTVFVTTA